MAIVVSFDRCQLTVTASPAADVATSLTCGGVESYLSANVALTEFPA